MDGPILPYRTGAQELVRWLEGRARGRTAAQLRDAGLSPKVLEGVAAAAAALGLADADGELTALGRRFALAAPAERTELLREAMLRFAPYGAVLRAIAARGGERTTEVGWIETWWATHGHGNSQSNRREGAATFGRLAEWTGLGRYIPGRRGHPTRIEWTPGALSLAGAAERAPREETAPPPAPAPPPTLAAPPPPSTRVEREGGAAGGEMNRVALPLRSGQTARLEVPVRLPRAEKRRLLELLELLILEE